MRSVQEGRTITLNSTCFSNTRKKWAPLELKQKMVVIEFSHEENLVSWGRALATGCLTFPRCRVHSYSLGAHVLDSDYTQRLLTFVPTGCVSLGRKAIDDLTQLWSLHSINFCVSIFYSVSSQKMFNKFKSFLMNSIGFFFYFRK